MSRLTAVIASIFMATALVAASQVPGSQLPTPAQIPRGNKPPPPTPNPVPDNPEPKNTVPDDPATGSYSPSIPDNLTVTGCLTQGSASTIFVLNDARTAVELPTEGGKSYVVVRGSGNMNLAQNVNHEVRVVGTTDKAARAPMTSAKVAEKDLPTLSATRITSVADHCAAASAASSKQ